MKLGILRETKVPADKRVALTPLHCRQIKNNFTGVEIVVQPDKYRAFADEEYMAGGVKLQEDVNDCDILLGIKEVAIDTLIPGKTYFFFSHTAKKQAHNRKLLREILKRKITLIDYEYLTRNDNSRVVAFGRWAGIVGAYNGLRAAGERYGSFKLKPAWQCTDKEELLRQLKRVKLPDIKILITGGGRVAGGAMEILTAVGVKKAAVSEFPGMHSKEPVYVQLDPCHYVKRINGKEFDLQHFFDFPQEYENSFLPFTKETDLLIACHFWDPRAPVLMKKEDMRKNDFRISVIADISCDVNGPIPSTIRVSTIINPFYGYDPVTDRETDPFHSKSITVMAVDNLPGELPRDASEDFGEILMKEVLPSLFGKHEKRIIEKGIIADKGRLTDRFSYLDDYVKKTGTK